jgi:hypothetical protein
MNVRLSGLGAKSGGRRVAAIIVMIVFGGFGAMMLYVGITQHFEQKRLLSSAQTVEAEITRSEVVASTTKRVGETGTGTTTYGPEVAFAYEVGGVKYSSTRLYPTIIAVTHGSHDSAAEVLRPFPLGAKVKAFVDATMPDKAFLIAQAGAGPMVFIIVGLLVPPVAWAVARYLI